MCCDGSLPQTSLSVVTLSPAALKASVNRLPLVRSTRSESGCVLVPAQDADRGIDLIHSEAVVVGDVGGVLTREELTYDVLRPDVGALEHWFVPLKRGSMIISARLLA